MAENTALEFVHHTFSPWRGCQEIDSGCLFCYAREFSSRNPKVMGGWGNVGPRVLASRKQWRKAKGFNSRARRLGEMHRVYFNWADPFEDWPGVIKDTLGRTVQWCDRCQECKRSDEICRCDPVYRRRATMHDVRMEFFQLIDSTPDIMWMLQTKRPEEVYHTWPGGERHNVMLGISATDTLDAARKSAELEKLSHLAAGTWCELSPLLGPVNVIDAGLVPYFVCEKAHRFLSDTENTETTCPHCKGAAEFQYSGVDWILVGGETGGRARPCQINWIRAIIEPCRMARVPVYVHQLGLRAMDGSERLPLQDNRGRDTSEWPGDLVVREYPDFGSLAEEDA